MSKEVSVLEYKTIIIPLHEELVRSDLIKAQRYADDSIERKALILSAQLKEIHVQYLLLQLFELENPSVDINNKINTNQKNEREIREKLGLLNIDVRQL